MRIVVYRDTGEHLFEFSKLNLSSPPPIGAILVLPASLEEIVGWAKCQVVRQEWILMADPSTVQIVALYVIEHPPKKGVSFVHV